MIFTFLFLIQLIADDLRVADSQITTGLYISYVTNCSPLGATCSPVRLEADIYHGTRPRPSGPGQMITPRAK
jgi:hypothetical protein